MRANLLRTPARSNPASPRWTLPTLLVVLSAGSAGCGVSAESLETGSIAQSIVGGADTDGFQAVVNLGGGGSACSATLIAPNLMLTAMHCVVAKALIDDFQCMSDGSVTKGTEGAGDLGQLADPSKIQARGIPVKGKFPVYAQGKQLFTTNSSHVCHDDLALVLLDRDVDLPIMPLRLESPTEEGELIAAVGYGQTESATSTVTRREVRNIEILAVGGSGKSGGTSTPSGVITPRSVAQSNTFATGPAACKGDSGGPAFSEETGAVVGVFSYFLNECATSGTVNIFTRTAPYKGLILSALDAAGYPVWHEGTDAPGLPAPAPKVTEPEPVATTSPEPEELPVAQRQRLKSGCNTALSTSSEPGVGALLLVLAAFVRRSKR